MSNRIEDLEVYTLAEAFADEIWFLVATWDYFTKDTVGKQLTRSADSISANIAEGFGRYHYRKIRTFVISAEGRLLKKKLDKKIKYKKINY